MGIDLRPAAHKVGAYTTQLQLHLTVDYNDWQNIYISTHLRSTAPLSVKSLQLVTVTIISQTMLSRWNVAQW